MNFPYPFVPKRKGFLMSDKMVDAQMPMPRVIRTRGLEEQNIAAVETALTPDPRPMPNSSDQVVQSFIDMGKNIATAMRKAGDACEEQGKRRKDEYYKAAEVAERKGEFQAREAGEFIDSILAINTAVTAKITVNNLVAPSKTVNEAEKAEDK